MGESGEQEGEGREEGEIRGEEGAKKGDGRGERRGGKRAGIEENRGCRVKKREASTASKRTFIAPFSGLPFCRAFAVMNFHSGSVDFVTDFCVNVFCGWISWGLSSL